jgi:quinoprotein glucose dehydrogenase
MPLPPLDHPAVMPASLVRLALIAVAATAPALALAVPDGHPPPVPRKPTIAPKSDEPVRAAAAFGLPAGFSARLFAAEPDVANPVAFSVDERGRAFVCETFRQGRAVNDNRGHDEEWVNADLAAQTVADRDAFFRRLLPADTVADWERDDDRIRLLEDTDGDGLADRVAVYADGFNGLMAGTAAGILARRGDVWLACIPSFYRLRDVDGDGRIDSSPAERVELSTGYGIRVALRGHDLHGILRGPDGRLYFSIGDRGYKVTHDGTTWHDPGSGAVFRCQSDGSGFEVFATSLRNPQELAFDDLGNLFTVDNNSDAGDQARLVHLLPGCDSGWNMAFQSIDDRGPWHREKLWHTAHDGQPAWIVPPLAHVGAGPSGLCYAPGTGLPPFFDRRFLLCDFRGGAANSSIRTFRVVPRGASFAPADEEETFRHVLATDVEVGPDGALWVSDWVHGWEGEGKGRLWRFVPQRDAAGQTLADEVRGLLAGDWESLDAARLAALLGHADRRVRLEAQWELARRGDPATLGRIAVDSSAPLLARVHAIQGASQVVRGGAGVPEEEVAAALARLCTDPAWELRLVAAREAGEIGAAAARSRDVLRRLLADESLQVRGAAAIALGRIGRTVGPSPVDRVALLALAGAEGATDPHLRHAVVMGLVGAATPADLASLVSHSAAAVRLAAVVALRRQAAADGLAAFLDDADPRVATEAARAVHDLPLRGAWPALAARVATGTAEEAFLRRALAAAEASGSAEDAARVVALAARSDAPPALRVLALETLRTWAEPPQRSRVHGGWHPHGRRDPAAARLALERALPALIASNPDDALRASLLKAAAGLGVESVGPLLVAWADDAARDPTSRAEALLTLDAARDPLAEKLAARLVSDTAPAVRAAARRVRTARLPVGTTVAELVEATTQADTAERQAAIELLGGIDHPDATRAISALVARLAGADRDPTIELEINEAAARRLGPAVAERLAAERLAAATPGDTTAAWRDVAAGGDPARGRSIFFNNGAVSCVRCHRADGVGGDVGPKLDAIAAQKDLRHLLEAIVAPSAQVAEAYRTTLVVTDDGRTVAGIVAGEGAGRLALKTADGAVVTIPLDSIEERAAGPSSMPADLAGKLTRRELRDLLAWLLTLR